MPMSWIYTPLVLIYQRYTAPMAGNRPPLAMRKIPGRLSVCSMVILFLATDGRPSNDTGHWDYGQTNYFYTWAKSKYPMPEGYGRGVIPIHKW